MKGKTDIVNKLIIYLNVAVLEVIICLLPDVHNCTIWIWVFTEIGLFLLYFPKISKLCLPNVCFFFLRFHCNHIHNHVLSPSGGCVIKMFPSSMSAYMTQHGRILSVVSNMSYYQYQQDDMSYYQPHTRDMSSYVAVQGVPRKDNCNVFGLTPQEVRYLRVSANINTNYFLLLSHKKLYLEQSLNNVNT